MLSVGFWVYLLRKREGKTAKTQGGNLPKTKSGRGNSPPKVFIKTSLVGHIPKTENSKTRRKTGKLLIGT